MIYCVFVKRNNISRTILVPAGHVYYLNNGSCVLIIAMVLWVC